MAATAAYRIAAAPTPSVSNFVNVKVDVTAGGIVKRVTHHRRYGPPTGSRNGNASNPSVGNWT
jgi:hypothetical protein